VIGRTKTRLLARAAQNGDRVLACRYRAATVREPVFKEQEVITHD